MKTQKLSLQNVKMVLSRSEMKKIMAGSSNSNCCFCINLSGGSYRAETTQDCATYCGNNGGFAGGGC